MLESSLAPYLLWAKMRSPAPIDLAGSNLLHCTLDDLPGAREALDLSAPNDNGYAPVREAIAQHYGVGVEHVVTANGCSGANFLTVAALVGAGDDVLIERPAYDPLIGCARLMGANVTRFERRAEDGFALDVDAVRAAMTPRTRLIVVTSPHNPSGVAIEPRALAELVALADAHRAHVLVDEVYRDAACIVRGEEPAAGCGARVHESVIVTSSLTKSYGLAGLRAGWVIAPAALAERVRRTRDVVDNASTGPADRLAALAWSQLPALSARTRELLGGNLARARAFFAQHPILQVPEPPSCSVIFPRIAGHASAELFVQEMLDRDGVALAPGRFFEAPGHFRISLAGEPARLEAGLAAIGKRLGSLNVPA